MEGRLEKCGNHRWRAMAPSDIDGVCGIADVVHPNYPEDRGVFEDRLANCPEGCRVLEQGNRILGYVLSHPWRFGRPPKLNQPLGALPPQPDTYYIHDVALLPETRGIGAASPLIEALAALAAERGLPTMSLIAVNGSEGFWRRHGFRRLVDPAIERTLASYDADACFMVREIRQEQAAAR